jgi:predicted negative regulator of RcsB-dependent stress response
VPAETRRDDVAARSFSGLLSRSNDVTSAIRKEELRRNVLAEWLGACVGFVRGHRTAAMAAAIAVVVALIAGFGFRWYQEGREREAARALAQAYGVLQSQNPQTPADPVEGMKQLRAITQTFPGTRSAEEALLRLAYLQYDAQRPDEALATLDEYDKRYPRGRFRVMADLGRGYALLAKQNLDGAAQAFSGIISRDATDPLAGEAYMSLARVYEAQKKTDEALKIYGQVVDKFPQTNWSQEALQRMNALRQ